MSMEIPAQAGDRVIRIGGCPNERQAQFFASRATFTAYGGARGGGKSWALRRVCAIRASTVCSCAEH